MCFAKDMMSTKEKLEILGHNVSVPCDTDVHIDDPLLRDDFKRDKEHVLKNDILQKCFDLLAGADAVLVLNKEQKGVRGYIGVSALMEIGLAYYLKKKIFVLNQVYNDERYSADLDVMGATVLDGDLSKIS